MSRHGHILETVRPRLPATSTTALVLAGDVLGICTLLVVGLYHHSIPTLEFPMHTAKTILPFATAWLVVAPAIGLYLPTTLTSYRHTVGLVIVGWTGSALLGSLLRSTEYFPGNAPLTFVLVQIASGSVLLLPWRLAITTGLNRLTAP
jgi:hypothetical protein